MPAQEHTKHGYSMYSARFGNLYTTRQLLQLAKEAEGSFSPVDAVWSKDGRYFDALRPAVEPSGLSTPEEVRLHRDFHLAKVREMIEQMDLFIFTLGLTETWRHKASGTVFPLAPGTIAGQFDPDAYEFLNLNFNDSIGDFREFIGVVNRIRGDRPRPRYLLTVSPVPLTATATAGHVLQATTYSKSVLRAVAGQLSANFKFIDYFPSYEIITNQAARGTFYSSNLRSIRSAGVETVMKVFFSEHRPGLTQQAVSIKATGSETTDTNEKSEDEVQCEEVLLEAFNKK